MVFGNKGILNFNSCRIRYDPMLKLTSVSFPWKILPNFYDLIFQRGIIFTKILSITVSRVITISLVSQRLSEQFYLQIVLSRVQLIELTTRNSVLGTP